MAPIFVRCVLWCVVFDSHTAAQVGFAPAGASSAGRHQSRTSLKPLSRLALHALDCDHRARGIHLRLSCGGPVTWVRRASHPGRPRPPRRRKERCPTRETRRAMGSLKQCRGPQHRPEIRLSTGRAAARWAGLVAVRSLRSACSRRKEPWGCAGHNAPGEDAYDAERPSAQELFFNKIMALTHKIENLLRKCSIALWHHGVGRSRRCACARICARRSHITAGTKGA